MKNNLIPIIAVFVVMIATSFDLFAADSLVVQTFTFDSISTRTATFQFPDSSEKYYKVIAKYRLKCDPKTPHDQYDCGEWDYHAYTKIRKANDAEVEPDYEIFRFITPYGINLSLGVNGFEWEYDVTDFMYELRGDITISSHNLQELLDLKFIFYKGEPYRDVLRIQEPWGSTQHSRSYKDLVQDKELKAVTMDILPETKSVKLKTRITGHGMSPGTSGLQCCEFYDNTHYLSAAGSFYELDVVATWKIWVDCSTNPVYPQGGTWTLQREGWCPGDAVKEYDFELMQYVKDGKLALDYDISDKAYNQLPATGDGYYTMGFQLVEYGASKYKNDLELYEVLSPSTKDYYNRFNPICDGFKLVVRNNSDEDITKFTLRLKSASENGTYEHYDGIKLSKPLKPYQFDTIIYFVGANALNPFWSVLKGVDNPKITIEVSNPDDKEDDNPSNNVMEQPIKLPDVLDKNNVIVKYRTNKRPQDYTVRIYSDENKIVKEVKNAAPEKYSNFTMEDLPNGCYRFEIEDTKGIYGTFAGLSYWYIDKIADQQGSQGQGNGSIGFTSLDGLSLLKRFNPDFGKNIVYSFVLNSFSSVTEDEKIALSIYPNPTSDILNIHSYETVSNAVIEIFDATGQVILTLTEDMNDEQTVSVNVSQCPVGAYQVRVKSGKRATWGNFIKK